MVTVGIRELKNQLSAYLARVRDGETLVVTDRGKEIARVVPIHEDEDSIPGWYRKLVAEGTITPARRRGGIRNLPPPIEMTPGDETMVDYVLEQRR